jgi:DNA-binding GntR family transcriptional regulator
VLYFVLLDLGDIFPIRYREAVNNMTEDKEERLKQAHAERDKAARARDEAYRAVAEAGRAWDKAVRKICAIEAEP